MNELTLQEQSLKTKREHEELLLQLEFLKAVIKEKQTEWKFLKEFIDCVSEDSRS